MAQIAGRAVAAVVVTAFSVLPADARSAMTNLLRSGLVLTVLALTASSAAAQGRAWCLYENNSRGAVTCSFHTFEQCLASRSGVGGSCGANPYPSYGTRYSDVGATGRRKPRR